MNPTIVSSNEIQSSLDPFFRPDSIAVIGASRDADSMGGMLFSNLIHSFNGDVYPVNPNTDLIAGRQTYSSLADIDGEIDLAYIAVPSRFVESAIDQCLAKPVRGIVLITAGFSEVDETGGARERRIHERVLAAGIRMFGPNCMGVLNTDPDANLNGTFSHFFPSPGNVAVATQSGALGYVCPDYIQQWNVGVSQFASLGNKVDTGENDLLKYWRDDPRTNVIQLYLESFQDPRQFRAIARQVSLDKPIVMLKSGRTRAGQRAAGSHTAALASPERAVAALAKQTGVIRCTDLRELFATTALLCHQPLPRGPRVAVVTNAGGPGILCVDALESRGLEIPTLSDSIQRQLREFLRPETTTTNPIDLIGSMNPHEYRRCLELLLGSTEFDAIVVIYVPRADDTSNAIAEAIHATAASQAEDTTVLAVFMESHAQSAVLQTGDYRIPCFEYPESAAVALSSALSLTTWRSTRKEASEAKLFQPHEKPPFNVPIIRRVLDDARNVGQSDWLVADDIQRLLTACGLAVPESNVVRSVDAAVSFFEQIGAPVVLKVMAADILHKSDVGGVRLGLETAADVRAAFDDLTTRFSDYDGILVQRMVSPGCETIIGVSRDPQFGHLIGFGSGGTLVELVDDMAFRLAPLETCDLDEMIAETRASRLLTGFRGSEPSDVNALKNTLLRISALVSAFPEIAEIDLNPVIVHSGDSGVSVVDARICLDEPGT